MKALTCQPSESLSRDLSKSHTDVTIGMQRTLRSIVDSHPSVAVILDETSFVKNFRKLSLKNPDLVQSVLYAMEDLTSPKATNSPRAADILASFTNATNNNVNEDDVRDAEETGSSNNDTKTLHDLVAALRAVREKGGLRSRNNTEDRDVPAVAPVEYNTVIESIAPIESSGTTNNHPPAIPGRPLNRLPPQYHDAKRIPFRKSPSMQPPDDIPTNGSYWLQEDPTGKDSINYSTATSKVANDAKQKNKGKKKNIIGRIGYKLQRTISHRSTSQQHRAAAGDSSITYEAPDSNTIGMNRRAAGRRNKSKTHKRNQGSDVSETLHRLSSLVNRLEEISLAGAENRTADGSSVADINAVNSRLEHLEQLTRNAAMMKQLEDERSRLLGHADSMNGSMYLPSNVIRDSSRVLPLHPHQVVAGDVSYDVNRSPPYDANLMAQLKLLEASFSPGNNGDAHFPATSPVGRSVEVVYPKADESTKGSTLTGNASWHTGEHSRYDNKSKSKRSLIEKTPSPHPEDANTLSGLDDSSIDTEGDQSLDTLKKNQEIASKFSYDNVPHSNSFLNEVDCFDKIIDLFDCHKNKC